MLWKKILATRRQNTNGITNNREADGLSHNTALPEPVARQLYSGEPHPITKAEPQHNRMSDKRHHKNKPNILPTHNYTPLTLPHTVV